VDANYAALMNWGMQLSLGCATTSPCLEFANLADRDNLFFLTPTASADVVIINSNNGYQMCVTDSKQGIAAAEYFNSLGISKIGVLYVSDISYSMDIYSQFIANLNDSIAVVAASFTGHTAYDFTAQIAALKDCEIIFMPIYYTDAARFMMQAKNESGIKAYYACDSFDGIEYAEGFDITGIPQKIVMLTDFDATAAEGEDKAFADKYVARFGAETCMRFAALAYDSIYAIYGALEAAVVDGAVVNENTTVSEMCEILKAQFDGDYVFTNAVTGGTVTWTNGFANKVFIEQVIHSGN
jgi:branched-chain amino acid transport system substrate-binding protein